MSILEDTIKLAVKFATNGRFDDATHELQVAKALSQTEADFNAVAKASADIDAMRDAGDDWFAQYYAQSAGQSAVNSVNAGLSKVVKL